MACKAVDHYRSTGTRTDCPGGVLATLTRPLSCIAMSEVQEATVSVSAYRKPAASPAERVQQDQNRADFMEFLYVSSGRSDPSHPQANTYTGLFEASALKLGAALLQDLREEWHTFTVQITNHATDDESTMA